MDDSIKIGKNVVLSGFGTIEPSLREGLNKIVGDYTRRFSSQCERFQQLHLTMKGVHAEENENAKKVEIHGKLLDNGRTYSSEVVDHDLLSSLDKALKKLENSVVR